MKRSITAFTFMAALAAATLAQPPGYHPQWEIDDAWRVKITTRVLEHDRSMEIPTDGSYPVYPHPGYADYLPDEESVYEYRVVESGTNYQYKTPLFDPFVARPGKPNVESNWTRVAVINVECVTNSGLCSNWTLFFETNNVALIQVSERTSDWGWGKVHGLNPYGRGSWLTHFLGDKQIIHDFPRIPDGATNEAGVVTWHNHHGGTVTQTVFFGENVVTQTLERWSDNYRLPQKASFVWEKDKKWWSYAKVELGTNLVVSGELINP